MSDRDDARKFWESQKEYPNYGTIKPRRLYELNTLVPLLTGVASVLDVGCGDGALARCLEELTDAELSCCDLADYGGDKPGFFLYDVMGDEPLMPAEFVVFAGVAPYVFDDDDLTRFFGNLKAEELYVRAPCSVSGETERARGHSEKLGQVYAAKYRTPDDLRGIIHRGGYTVTDVGRSYPDEIESEFGTKQFWFLCESG